MKNVLTLLLACIVLLPSSFALDASIHTGTFSAPNFQYIEVYTRIIGNTISYKPIDSLSFQASVEVSIVFYQGDKIAQFDKFVLNGPIQTTEKDLIDLQRYQIAPGNYRLEVSLTDLHYPTNKSTYSTEVVIDPNQFKGGLSDIILLNEVRTEVGETPFHRNGIYMEPLPTLFVEKNKNELYFYCEIYGTPGEEDIVVSYGIESNVNGKSKLWTVAHKRKVQQEILPVLMPFDIKSLPSGKYQLFVELKNKAFEVQKRIALTFYRSNPDLEFDEESLVGLNIAESFVGQMTADSLRYALKAIAPIIPQNDVSMLNDLIKEKKLEAQKLYLYSYWARQEPREPGKAYNEYMKVAKAVDKKYRSGFGYGFETDRGFRYMKYGKPDDIVSVDNEPTAPPYEIWVYYDFPMTRQSNVKFLFYNRSLAGGDYQLLHSTAIGEFNNPRWEAELYQQATSETPNNNMDGVTMQDNNFRMARRYFNDF